MKKRVRKLVFVAPLASVSCKDSSARVLTLIVVTQRLGGAEELREA